MTTAGVLAGVLLAGFGVFQLALAGGAPLGAAAWGGQHPGVLPGRLRVASAVTGLLVYPLVGLLILNAAGLVDVAWLPGSAVVMWVLTGFFALGAVGNLASRSRIERIWAPVSGAIAVCCAVIALGL